MKTLKIFCLMLAFATTWSAFAQEATLPTPDAKALAMGGVTMTTQSASHAIYNNASMAVFTNHPVYFSSSYYRQNKDDAYAITGAIKIGYDNLLQAGWRQYLRENGRKDMAVDFGYSRKIGENLAIGVIGRYLHQRISDEQTEDAIAVDLSAFYTIPMENVGSYSEIRLGGKLANLGAYLHDSDYYLPMNANFGAAFDTYITDEHEITLAADVGYYFYPKSLRGFLMSVGMEYNLMQLIQFRGGYHFGEKDSYYPSYGSAGVGIRFMHLRLDFAYLFAKKDTPFRNTYSLSFGLDF